MRPYLEVIRWGNLKMVGRGDWTSFWWSANVSVLTEVLVWYNKKERVKDENFLLCVKKKEKKRKAIIMCSLFYDLLLSLLSD